MQETVVVVLDVRFLSAATGARIAYTVGGSGPPLVLVPPWTSHLLSQAQLSGHRRFTDALHRHHTVITYDRWGTGLSDRDRSDFTLEADVQVVQDVADHLRLRRFALLGPSQAAPVAVSYAAREPRRVSHLVLYGASSTGVNAPPTWSALRTLILVDWPVAVTALAAVLAAGGQRGDLEALQELLRSSATPEMMVALQDAALQHDVSAALDELRVPTLVVHRRGDTMVGVEHATRLAGRIAGARLELLDDSPHVHYLGRTSLLAERITAFTAGTGRAPSAQLSEREAQVLHLVAEGCSNAEVAERLVLSVRTVERHLLNSYTKLGVRGRAAAVALWTRRHAAPTA